MNSAQNPLGTQPIGRLLVKLAIPTVIAQLINVLYNIVDRIYIGNIPGTGAMAADWSRHYLSDSDDYLRLRRLCRDGGRPSGQHADGGGPG